MNNDEVYRLVRKAARADAAQLGIPVPTQEYLTRHALESFIDRLNHTRHARDFVLKGGILLGAYSIRRPTKDVDTNAVSANVSSDYLQSVMHDIAHVAINDGIVFDLDSLHRVIGDPITVIGYTPESTVAEKGVTILERGITSTRWRDYVDIVALANIGLKQEELAKASRAVASYRGVDLQPIGSAVEGYGVVGQAKWAAWRRKQRLTGICEENLDDQMKRVALVLDPVFASERD